MVVLFLCGLGYSKNVPCRPTLVLVLVAPTYLLYVSSEVSGIRITSSSFIIGTGLKKWRPPNLKGAIKLAHVILSYFGCSGTLTCEYSA